MTEPDQLLAAEDLRHKRLQIVWWGLALGIVAGCAVNSISGFDWFTYYYPQARQVLPERLYNPLWIYFLLTPIAFLPYRVSFIAFTSFNAVAIWLAGRLTGANRFAVLLSFPAFWLLWYGQIDGLVMLGVAAGWWAVQRQRPIVLGIALLLLLAKPQVGGPLAVVYFLWLPNWRSLVTCSLILFVSLLVWGWGWPVIWIQNLLQAPSLTGPGGFVRQGTNISLYPYGLFAWLVLLIPMPRLERAMTILSVTFLSMPYAANYSLLSLLVLPEPWWVYALSSTPYVLGPKGYGLTILAPLACLGWTVVKSRQALATGRFSFRNRKGSK